MGVFLGISYILFVFGPALAFYIQVISQTALTNLLAMSSAFFLVLSVLLPSFLEGIKGGVIGNTNLIPLFITVAVISQEIFRFLFLKAYLVAEITVILRAKIMKSLFSDLTSAIAIGFGFGVAYSLIMHSGVISAAFNEPKGADFYDVNLCPEISLYIVSAITALEFQLFHIALTVLLLHAFRQREKTPGKFLIWEGSIIFLHLAASLSSTINGVNIADGGGCKIGIPIMTAVVLFTLGLAIFIVKQEYYTTTFTPATEDLINVKLKENIAQNVQSEPEAIPGADRS